MKIKIKEPFICIVALVRFRSFDCKVNSNVGKLSHVVSHVDGTRDLLNPEIFETRVFVKDTSDPRSCCESRSATGRGDRIAITEKAHVRRGARVCT